MSVHPLFPREDSPFANVVTMLAQGHERNALALRTIDEHLREAGVADHVRAALRAVEDDLVTTAALLEAKYTPEVV